MENNQRPQKPTGTLQERVERLSEEFKPDHNGGLINLTKDLDFKETVESRTSMLERFEAFSKNGNSDQGLWFEGSYKKAVGY